jgi:hypothetical protein
VFAFLYRSVLYVHILAGFVFLLSHGASASVAFRLRHETEMGRIRALLDLSSAGFTTMYASLGALIILGVALGFMGHWWANGWIWAALVLLIAIAVAISVLAVGHFAQVRKAVGQPFMVNYKEQPPVEPASPEEIARLLASGRPYRIALIGLGGWAVVLLLMVFRPF